MGKRSRKRPAPDRPATTRAERDALRRTPPARRATREKPPAPWGSFPLTELVVLLALILGVLGFINLSAHRGKIMVMAAMVLGSLGGLEVSIREHFAGFKSHTTLIAGSLAVGAMFLIAIVGRGALGTLGVAVGAGLLIFAVAFRGLRQAFVRRSGGARFR